MLLALPALVNAQQPAAGSPPYKIGFVGHLTGDMATYGQSLKRAWSWLWTMLMPPEE